MSIAKNLTMKRVFSSSVLIVIAYAVTAQTSPVYSRLLSRYEQWKAAQYKAGKYATPGNCKMDIVIKEGYTGPMAGIPEDISIHYSDINGDGIPDALITFHPVQCDGGNAMMHAQSRVLFLSKGAGWVTDDSYIDNIERKKNGWLVVSGVKGETIFGTYYEYKDEDGRCCPSIKKQFTIDYKTKKLETE
jgi:hypothetical protein